MKSRDKMMNRISVGYIRNSRSTQENSVETQKNIIEEYCERYGLELNEIIIDEGISGSGEKVNDRVGYKKILKMIGDGELDNLIVLSISRWGRSVLDICRSIDLMEKNNSFRLLYYYFELDILGIL